MSKGKPEFLPDFFVTPWQIWQAKSVPPVAEKVFAIIYWYERMKDGTCTANNATIARILGSSNANSVSNAIAKLIDSGFVTASYGPNGDRLALNTTVSYTLHQTVEPPTSNDVPPLHQTVYDNKNIKLEKIYTSETSDEIAKLYRGWLIEMVIGAGVWLGIDTDSRTGEIEIAAKKVRLTPKRKAKIATRLESLGYSVCANAIKHLAQSEWHRGDNNTGWKATIEWLFNSDEKTEEWANRK